MTEWKVSALFLIENLAHGGEIRAGHDQRKRVALKDKQERILVRSRSDF